MVLTPDFGPVRPSEPLSPLLLATTPRSNPLPPRRSSTGNYSQLSDFRLDSDKEIPEILGVRHVDLSLNSAEWRQPVFKEKILVILKRLKATGWSSTHVTPSSIHLQKVSGAMTNAVFFVSFNPAPAPTPPGMSPLLTPTLPPSDPNHPPPFPSSNYPPTLLLRIYGPSSDALISRTEELRMLQVLSTEYGLGPKLYGTFDNGRVEQFFPSRALTAVELRDPKISACIAKRMRELHSVDLKLMGYKEPKPMTWSCLKKWVPSATSVLEKLAAISARWAEFSRSFDMPLAQAQISQYSAYVSARTRNVIFAHNDTQYGNILKLDTPRQGPEHHQYIVIDFEYAGPNTRGYDIANHFHEWRANYHHPTLSHSLQPHYPYPTLEERQHFYRAYLDAQEVDELEAEVRLWSPASSVFWAIWGLVQAEEQVENLLDGITATDFDYLSYALERMEMFRKEATELGALDK